jgi:hypothetical protein
VVVVEAVLVGCVVATVVVGVLVVDGTAVVGVVLPNVGADGTLTVGVAPAVAGSGPAGVVDPGTAGGAMVVVLSWSCRAPDPGTPASPVSKLNAEVDAPTTRLCSVVMTCANASVAPRMPVFGPAPLEAPVLVVMAAGTSSSALIPTARASVPRLPTPCRSDRLTRTMPTQGSPPYVANEPRAVTL